MKNSLFILLLVLMTQNVKSQSTASAQVSTFEIEAPQLETKKKIWVYLPKDYQKSHKHYPVIYMFDAQNLFDTATSYVGEWEVDEYLDGLERNQSIIIGIEHGNEKRIGELTPYKHNSYGGGQGNLFLKFIIETLKPHIDLTYKTLPNAKSTSIIGSSLGGLMAFYATIKFPETFSKAGILSPAFWINPEIFDLVKSAEIPETSYFYFLVGTEEGESMVPNQHRMVDLLIQKGVSKSNLEHLIIEGGKHNELFWGEHFPNTYQWIIKKN